MAIFPLIFAADSNYKLNLVIGLFLWDFFAEGTKSGLASLHAKGFLLTKAKFPIWILVATSASNAVIALSVFSLVLFAYLAYAGALSLASAALYILYQICFLLIVVGVSLATSVLFLRYRDLNQIWDLTLQAGFFVAPIIYPLGLLPEFAHAPLYLWPPTPIIQFSRDVLVGGVVPTPKAHLLLVLCTAAIFAAGALLYRWLSPRSAEYLG
jgi:lipopolysaccharide transport system permease protein